MLFPLVILALTGTSAMAAELRGAHNDFMERELAVCKNTADYGFVDQGCTPQLPVCVDASERYLPASVDGALCARCINSYPVDGPPPLFWPDFSCPSTRPKCLKADYTEPTVWNAGMICVDGKAACYNSVTLPGVDYKCPPARPICVLANGTEPALNSRGAKCVNATGTNTTTGVFRCYNNANLTSVDTNCTAANPICVLANGTEPARNNPGDKCVNLTWTNFTKEEDYVNNNTELINVITYNDSQLVLEAEGKAYNFFWVPESGLGTVVKIDIRTATVVGRYKTWPDSYGVGGGNPSRTTVDNDGSLWVANRNDYNGHGTVTHIGLEENGQCEDRNGNGIIETSTGLTDLRAWADDSGTRHVATADDECIVHFVAVNSSGTRHISVNQDNDVWVSGWGRQDFDLIKGGRFDVASSGTILTSYPSVGAGGYGGLIDPNGTIWSAVVSRGLLRWDPSGPLSGPNGAPGGLDVGPPITGTTWAANSDGTSYGLCVGSDGIVWNTDYFTGQIKRYAPDGRFLSMHATGGSAVRGCVVDELTGDVWTANTDTHTASHLKSDGSLVGVVPVGLAPTGVAVDRMGKIWIVNLGSDHVQRIDPTLNGGVGAVDLTLPLTPGSAPYSYSDMTGSTLTAPPTTGTWTVTHDSGVVGQKWGYVDWGATVPSDSTLTVEARSSVDGTTWVTAWETVTKEQDLTVPDGRYLQVRVSFHRATTDDTPILHWVSIAPSL